MSNRRLPITDLANISTLPKSEQKARLRLKRAFVAPYTLEHVRRNYAMLMGVGEAFDLGVARPSDDVLLQRLRESMKSPKDVEPNLRRAKALLSFASTTRGAVREEFRGLFISRDYVVRPSDSVVLDIGGKAYVPSTDLRRAASLTPLAIQFYFAANFHLIIDSEPDFKDAGLVLLKYWEFSTEEFGISPLFFSGRPMYSFEEIGSMVKFTLDLWAEVLEERREAAQQYGMPPDSLFGNG
jgi:hypothetical protein